MGRLERRQYRLGVRYTGPIVVPLASGAPPLVPLLPVPVQLCGKGAGQTSDARRRGRAVGGIWTCPRCEVEIARGAEACQAACCQCPSARTPTGMLRLAQI